MGSKRTDEVFLHQISLPGRRDYQLRSCSLKADALKFSSSQLVARAFQNARAISFNASHDEVPFVLNQAPNQRLFYSGPLTSQATPINFSGRADTTICGHAHEHSESEASFASAGSLGHSDDLSEAGRELSKDTVGGVLDKVAFMDEQHIVMSSTHSLNQSARVVKPSFILTPRRAVSGDQRTSMSNLDNRSRSGEVTRASRPSVDNSARCGEIIRASRSTLDSRGRNTEFMLAPPAGKPLKMYSQSGAKLCDDGDGPKVGEKGAGESRRRPTASIAWDSLNNSQENSPQHDLAAIPFKWEEAPGKPITIAVAAERSMARRLLKDGGESRSPHVVDAQRMPTKKVQKEAVPPSEEEETSARELHLSPNGMRTSPNSSFRSSHRFYARTASGERSFGPRTSIDSAHVISEVETEAHIDLVAPAAAKFLVESWVSPNVTPEQSLTTTIPFKWEEAPGVPKVDEEAIDSKPIQLQLPPRLSAPPPLSVDSVSKEEMRGRQRTRSMSGPLAGYYPHTSPTRRRQQQQSPPVMRSCSPSKRSISPSRIQALTKHFTRKASPTTHVENSREGPLSWSAGNRNYRHSYTYGHRSGPLEDFRDREASSNRALGRSTSAARANSEFAAFEQDEPKIRAPRSCTSGPLDSYAKPSKSRYSSPSKRSISPSRIHALAKQLTCKIKPASEVHTLEDPHWPVSIKHQVTRPNSFTQAQVSVSLDRGNVNAVAATESFRPRRRTPCEPFSSSSYAWIGKHQELGRDPWSPTSILQGPNDHSQAHASGPSSASDMDTQTQASTQATTPISVALSKSLSKSLSRISYESFEHSFTEPTSPSPEGPPTTEDAGNNSLLDSPYLGPTSADYRRKDSSGGAAEGVKAIIKMCRSGSTWRKSKTHSPEMWAPTLASYFQCLEATMSNPGNARKEITHLDQQEEVNRAYGSAQNLSELNEAQTRLPYTMPSHIEQKLSYKEYCDSPSAEFTKCLGVKLSPASFVSRGETYSSMESLMAWSERHLSHPTNSMEDGYRSPAYAATLELLSPSAELIRKKKWIMGTSRGVKLVIPSSSTRRRTHFVESMCKSLKRALYKCAKRCCRKTVKLQYNEEPVVLPPTEFSFYKPN
ncbi:uncharacterized protein [Physcomitrium patens]|uniref:Uncharacterized protein n=1 Tax=Physcomitrium patens TaxID=3218 RepID=A0A2K1J4P0_PHYPA|nr:uncharacterized protein LOC112294571 [Physcomitrium patens]PNR36488.1 hypothetical protein PHYPA_022339 [Physcomitrium patens]|eukprot:XP_024400943.1 uncharacterized protein LOC112294571 [Physcomitrella patens]